MKTLALYHYASSVCSQKVRFALEEKRLAWESRHVDLFEFENWDSDYLKLNPRGVVPTLVHGHDVVTESNIILEYLDDAFPDVQLRPAEPVSRARMRLWLRSVDEHVHPAVVEVSFNPRHRPRWAELSDAELAAVASRHPDPDLREDWLRRARDGVSESEEARHYRRLDRLCSRMDHQLWKSRWLAGATFSLADIALAPYIRRLECLGRSESLHGERRPKLAQWWRRLQRRPAFERAFAFTNPAVSRGD